MESVISLLKFIQFINKSEERMILVFSHSECFKVLFLYFAILAGPAPFRQMGLTLLPALPRTQKDFKMVSVIQMMYTFHLLILNSCRKPYTRSTLRRRPSRRKFSLREASLLAAEFILAFKNRRTHLILQLCRVCPRASQAAHESTNPASPRPTP